MAITIEGEGNYPGKPVMNYIMGVDLGQVQDYTAICVVQVEAGRWGIRDRILDIVWHPPLERQFNIVHLERIPLGTSYPDIANIVAERYAALPPEGGHDLLADATGVGRPVVQLMRQIGLDARAVTITGGNNVDGTAFGTKVPKRDLVSAVQVIMQNGQMHVAEGLREGPAFAKELQNFKYKINLAGHDTYEAWRERDKDDMVLACAIAVWWGKKTIGRVL